MAVAAAPCHAPCTSPEVTDLNEAAAEPSSLASPSQAAAAASIGPDPAPANIRPELISGGNTTKVINSHLSVVWSDSRLVAPPHRRPPNQRL